VASCICWSICFILQVPKQALFFFSSRWESIYAWYNLDYMITSAVKEKHKFGWR
jgi:hypothetical protein